MPGDDERPGGNQGASSSTYSSDVIQTSADRRQKPAPTHALARATRVIGGAGNPRWVLLWRDPVCGQVHVAHGRGESLPELLDRRGPHGPVTLHVVVTTATAAVAA